MYVCVLVYDLVCVICVSVGVCLCACACVCVCVCVCLLCSVSVPGGCDQDNAAGGEHIPCTG